jgi:hypothetical protein
MIRANVLPGKDWLSQTGIARKPSDIVRLYAEATELIANSATDIITAVIPIPHECYPVLGSNGAIISRVGVYIFKYGLQTVDWEAGSGVSFSGPRFTTYNLVQDTLINAGAGKGDYLYSSGLGSVIVQPSLSIPVSIANDSRFFYWEMNKSNYTFTTEKASPFGIIFFDCNITNDTGGNITALVCPFVELQKLRD